MTMDEEYEKEAIKIQKRHEKLNRLAEQKGYVNIDDSELDELMALAGKYIKKRC